MIAERSSYSLVPATMVLLGGAKWWLPRWLDRILPRMNLEAAEETDSVVPNPYWAARTGPLRR